MVIKTQKRYMKTLQFLLERYAGDHTSKEVLDELDRLLESHTYNIAKPHCSIHIESKPRLGVYRMRAVCSGLIFGVNISAYVESKSMRVSDSYNRDNCTIDSFRNDIYDLIREYTQLYICK